MFDLWCPHQGTSVLRWASHVEHLAQPAPGQIDLTVRCACGRLALLRTGRARGGDDVLHGVDAPLTAA